jgi:hypothetical protein
VGERVREIEREGEKGGGGGDKKFLCCHLFASTSSIQFEFQLGNALDGTCYKTFYHSVTQESKLDQSFFRAIGFFKEADALESSSILIYCFQEQSINTQLDGEKPY